MRQAVNTVIQGTAADVVKAAMVKNNFIFSIIIIIIKLSKMFLC